MNKKILSVLNPVYQHMRKNAIKLSTFLDSNNSFLGRKIQTMINTVLHRSYLAIFTTIRPAKFNPNWLIKNAFLTISEAQKIAKTPAEPAPAAKGYQHTEHVETYYQRADF